MASINTKTRAPKTHEGAIAAHINSEQQLRRSVMACMLWEDQFYEDGVSIADRIAHLISLIDSRIVSEIAAEARHKMKLRHVPLLLAVELARKGKLKANILDEIIQRPDELTEFLAIYWRKGRCPLSKQVKLGLAQAFPKFDAYQLGKYNRDKAIKLKDVLFLCHAKPKDNEQAGVWKKLIDGSLESPDTWEVNLSSGKDKKQTWTKLLAENKLGGMALLRNLRNMADVNVDEKLIIQGLANMNVSRILPFRFIAAARYAPQWESHIEKAMFKSLSEAQKFKGKTILLLDVSGSMDWDRLSGKSDMRRLDAACGVGICARDMCEQIAVYTFSNECVRVPDRRGFALRDAITNSQQHGGTYLAGAIDTINRKETYDRIIVVTDEQSHDSIKNPNGRGYVINVASYQNGVGYGKWLHIDGWSESVLKYIQEYECSFEN